MLFPVFFLPMTNNDIADIKVAEASNNPGPQVPVLSLEEMIKSALPKLDKLKEDLKLKKEMVEDALKNDSTYKNHSEKAKEANKIKNTTKQQLLKQPSLSTLTNDIKDLREEIKELQISLSEYLSEYGRLSGSNEIQDANGEVREIVYVAKLVRRNKN